MVLVAKVIAAEPPTKVCCPGAPKAIVGLTNPLPPESTVTDTTI